MFLLLKAYFCLAISEKKKVSNVEVHGTINCHSIRYLTKEVVFYQSYALTLHSSLIPYPESLPVHSHIHIGQIVNELDQPRNNSVQSIGYKKEGCIVTFSKSFYYDQHILQGWPRTPYCIEPS